MLEVVQDLAWPWDSNNRQARLIQMHDHLLGTVLSLYDDHTGYQENCPYIKLSVF